MHAEAKAAEATKRKAEAEAALLEKQKREVERDEARRALQRVQLVSCVSFALGVRECWFDWWLHSCGVFSDGW